MFTQSKYVYKDKCFQQPRAGRDHRVHTYPECSGGFDSTIHDALTAPSSKTMKSHCRLFDQRPQFQSPAKVFAKLKANSLRNNGGMQTYEDMRARTKENGGSVFLTPRKGKKNTREAKWTTDETYTFDRNDTEALTISPTRSPQHILPESFSNFRSKHRESSPIKDTRHVLKERTVYTPIKTPGQVTSNVLKSHKATPSRTSKDIVRTPSKGQPQLSNSKLGGTEVVVSLERYPLMSAAEMFVHIKERERKRMREHYDSPTTKFTNGAHACQPISHALNKDGPRSPSPSERDPTDSLVNDATDDWSPPARHPVVDKDLRRHDSSKAFLSKRQDLISLENLVSPAKTFFHMKRKRQQQEADNVGGNTKELATAGHRNASQKRPTSTAFDQEDTEYGTHGDTFALLPGRQSTAHRFKPEAADDPFESSRKDDAPFPGLKPQLVLVEDPLVIHSPHLLFPKKHKSFFKQNPAPLEKSQSKQQGSGYELAQWTIKLNREGLYVDGIRTLDNIPWHSTIIVERISNCVLKTLSGSTYTLIGKMNVCHDSKLPKWLLNKFDRGFPLNWKMHYESFQSQAKTAASSSSKDNLTRCPASAKPTTKYSEKKHGSMPSVTPASCFAMKTSRSGRVIKPPLEFWKGGRVILDANMNVTIHEAYETTVCMTQSNILASQLPKQDSGVFWYSSKAPQHSELTDRPAVDHQPSILQRKVKPVSRVRKAKKTHEPPNDQIHPPKKGRPRGSSSPEEEVHVPRTSKRQRLLKEPALQTARVPRRQDPPKHPSKKSPGDAGHVPKTALSKKLNIPASKEPPEAHSSASSFDEDISVRRKGRGKVHKKGMHQNVLNESQSSNSSGQSLSSPDGCGTVSRKDKGRTATRKDKGKRRSWPPKPAPKPVSVPASRRGDQSAPAPKRPLQQEEEGENWTEAELSRLKEAMASFPKHMGSYWVNVAMMVGTRSPEECQMQHTLQGSDNASSKKAKKKAKKKEESTTDQEPPKITARVGTLKRKEQVRQFMEAMPKDDHDDVFSSASMQNRRFQMPAMSPSGKEQGFMLSDLEPLTPRGASYLTMKTPPCLHITPGMIGSVNRKNDDKYIYQLQKRMKRRQVNACKLSSPMKTFPLTPSVKRNMRKCGNMDDDSFVVREMFPDNNGPHDESGEEEDFYFSDSN